MTPPSVVAIIAAFNEADIVGQVVADLVGQGIDVYVLDHGSTDGTLTALEPYLGHGVIAVERFPRDGATAEPADRFAWESILRRKEALAQELDATWFIHHDADEFREGPWAELDLAASIERVDRFGYNAIDFELLNFWPTHDDFRPGQDVRQAFPYYEPGQSWDKIQIRCWKKTSVPVDLVSTGGHEATFPGRRVFPIRFILRHYPIRGQAHGARKIFEERRPRFIAKERQRGWHVQYERFEPGQSFLRDPATMVRYDPELVRLDLMVHHRGFEELEALPDTERRLSNQSKRYEARLEQELDQRNHEVATLHRAADESNRECERLQTELGTRDRELHSLQRLADESNHDRERLKALERQLDEKNRQLEALHGLLHGRNLEVETLHRQLDERNQEVVRIEAALNAVNTHLAAIAQDLEDRTRSVESLQSELATAQAVLATIQASWLWRIGALFRRQS